MELKPDAVHVVGYPGALGSVVFGVNQLRVILARRKAEDVSVFDYAPRVAYSVALGVDAFGIQNLVFVVVNFAAGARCRDRRGAHERAERGASGHGGVVLIATRRRG